MRREILDTGLSVVYEPKDLSLVVDIIIIHRLQGHPFRTWAFSGSPEFSKPPDVKGKRKTSESSQSQPAVFWPADLLPAACPKARVLVFGYDSKITQSMSRSANQNSIVSHSKDLLFELQREAVPDRRLIFVAHSLGGIVSTAAVVFLGTPHRGSPDFVNMGELMRSIISALFVGTSSCNLHALGLRTTGLERAQEAFSQVWHTYNFTVKTFQEGLGLTGINLGMLGNKVVPDYSSLIGDYRERPETLQANHMDMCRFRGENDHNYRKVVGELRSIYLSIANVTNNHIRTQVPGSNAMDVNPRRSSMFPVLKLTVLTLGDDEKAFLQMLWFPSTNTRLRELERPAHNTCRWLFGSEQYRVWLSDRKLGKHESILRINGGPGTGKSTVMVSANGVNARLRSWDDGDDISSLERKVHSVPPALNDLYASMLTPSDEEDRGLMVRLFQWAILPTKPLRLVEWHHILAFTHRPTPASLHEWRESNNFTFNDGQLEKKIRPISKGLVEVKTARAGELVGEDTEQNSMYASAGSMNFEYGETRFVLVIHESVPEFFLSGTGFPLLDGTLLRSPIERGHLSIMATCLDYINIEELDALVQARADVERKRKSRTKQLESLTDSNII
ncbi:hypothetical protein QBC38DRAFT_445882 [Podospora fimiseda]|uniref:Nephrocystin 3-like N-terminal domain-containing protein n=1 Tax=Podospora fimiseda TaxID=252190 RepID=A0AAN7BKQ1_9PEZI|nr:hypothetical protein QBC38DRAFT_445882 [Podospora fimiseda]